MVKDLPVSAGDESSIPGLGRSISFPSITHSGILAWRIPWTEEPGGLQSIGSQREDIAEHPHTHATDPRNRKRRDTRTETYLSLFY